MGWIEDLRYLAMGCRVIRRVNVPVSSNNNVRISRLCDVRNNVNEQVEQGQAELGRMWNGVSLPADTLGSELLRVTLRHMPRYRRLASPRLLNISFATGHAVSQSHSSTIRTSRPKQLTEFIFQNATFLTCPW